MNFRRRAARFPGSVLRRPEAQIRERWCSREDHISFCGFIKGNIQPFVSPHPDRGRNVRTGRTQQAAASAFEVAALDFFASLGIPLPHEQCDPFACPRVAQHGEAGKNRPLVLFFDLILLSGIGHKLCHLHETTSPPAQIRRPIQYNYCTISVFQIKYAVF